MFRRLLLIACVLALGSCARESATIAAQDLARRLAESKAPALILDTRSAEEFAAGHVPGARLVPHDRIGAALAELAAFKHAEVVLYCHSGRRSGLAEAELREHGFTDLVQLDGSWQAWQQAGLPVEMPVLAAPAVEVGR